MTLFFLGFSSLQPKDAATNGNLVVQNHALKEDILNSLNGVIIILCKIYIIVYVSYINLWTKKLFAKANITSLCLKSCKLF